MFKTSNKISLTLIFFLISLFSYSNVVLAEEIKLGYNEKITKSTNAAGCTSSNTSCVTTKSGQYATSTFTCEVTSLAKDCTATVNIGGQAYDVVVGKGSTMGGGTTSEGSGAGRDEATNENNNSGTLTCNYILGDYNDPEDLGYYLAKLLEVIKIAGPVLVIVMTIVDLVKIIALGKPDELNKLVVKSIKRIIYAVLLFIIPSLLDWVFKLFSVYGVCIPS